MSHLGTLQFPPRQEEDMHEKLLIQKTKEESEDGQSSEEEEKRAGTKELRGRWRNKVAVENLEDKKKDTPEDGGGTYLEELEDLAVETLYERLEEEEELLKQTLKKTGATIAEMKKYKQRPQWIKDEEENLAYYLLAEAKKLLKPEVAEEEKSKAEEGATRNPWRTEKRRR